MSDAVEALTGLSEDSRNRVTKTWTAFANKQEDFYELGIPMFRKLFSDEPETIDLFNFDETDKNSIPRLKAHIKLLFDTIDYAINNIDNLKELTEIIVDLGTRHYHYGVSQKYYLVFGQCLCYAIEQALGKEQYTKDDYEAWMQFYYWIGGCIVKGIDIERSRQTKQ